MNNMNWFDSWMLKRIVRNNIKQGNWENGVRTIFKAVDDRYRYVFYEDNSITRIANLDEEFFEVVK